MVFLSRKKGISYDPKSLEDDGFVGSSFNSLYTLSNYVPRIRSASANERWKVIVIILPY
jgi:hypothetical protein